MFRSVSKFAVQVVKRNIILKNTKFMPATVTSLRYSSSQQETDEEFDTRYVTYFNKPDIDGWEIRKAMNDLQGLDLVPEPKIIIAGLKACRRVNDYALAVRFLEGVKEKCGHRLKEIYPYILQEIRPTLDELGVNTPEEMGYDKPELDLADIFERPFFPKKRSPKSM